MSAVSFPAFNGREYATRVTFTYTLYITSGVYDAGMADIMHMGTAELRNAIGPRVDAAHFLGEPTIVEKNGEPRAVLISYAKWVKWQEQDTEPSQAE